MKVLPRASVERVSRRFEHKVGRPPELKANMALGDALRCCNCYARHLQTARGPMAALNEASQRCLIEAKWELSVSVTYPTAHGKIRRSFSATSENDNFNALRHRVAEMAFKEVVENISPEGSRTVGSTWAGHSDDVAMAEVVPNT